MNTNSMQPRLRTKWVTYKEVPLWCCDFGGFGADQAELQAEIAASQAVIDQQPENSLLAAIDLSGARLTPEIVAFFNANAGRRRNRLRRMAILGVSDFQRWWYHHVKPVVWPRQSRFFNDWEQAKAWLVSER
jgi:hypothetical protein